MIFKKIAFIIICALTFSSCSILFHFIFRNHSQEKLTIRILDKVNDTLHIRSLPSYEFYNYSKEIVKIRKIYKHNFKDSIPIIIQGKDWVLDIPQCSTVNLGMSFNNPAWLSDRFIGIKFIAILEKNGKIIDTLNVPDTYSHKNWKHRRNGMMYYDYKN